ncbi:hypothetical protein ACFWPK_33845 [Nocardia sp. NPDC058519]|uniref:hypothetical protein n=1 Tax=Nocardia sp. NPDC058519 TaxID=3346535 RepID=UPI0036615B2F
MTTSLSAGWAVVSKQPGTHSDYAILASSRGPCPPAHVKQHVLARSPGNSPLASESGPAGLPWVWFMPVKGDDGDRYLGTVIRKWTDNVDATNRPIATNLFVYVPVEPLLASGCGLADLYTAVRDASLAPDGADPCASARLDLRLQASRGRDANPDLDAAALLAAAAVLDGPVKLRGGPSDLLARLTVLDSIAQLLPAGARVWLSAAAWSDATADPAPRLAFARGGRSGDAVIDLRTGAIEGRALSPTAAEYRRTLVHLRDVRGGAEAVAQHLSRQTATRERSANAALVALNDMDLKRIVLDGARAGSARVADIRRFGLVGLHEYNHDELSVVIGAYGRIATLADLVLDTPILSSLWRYADTEIVAAMARGLCAAPTAESVRRLAALAVECACHRLLVDALSDAQKSDPGALTSSEVVDEIIELAGDPVMQGALAPFIVDAASVAVEVARQVYIVGTPHLVGLAGQLDSATSADSVWLQVSNPLRRTLFDGVLAPTDLDMLWNFGPELVGEALDIVGRKHPAQLPRALDSALPILMRAAGRALPAKLLVSLGDLETSEPRLQAAVDLVLYRQGQAPRRSLSVGSDYRRELIAVAEQAALAESAREHFIHWVVERLDVGWTGAGASPVLDTLWRLTHPQGVYPAGADRVARAIAVDIGKVGFHVLAEPAIDQWLELLERDERIGGQVMLQRIRSLSTPQSVFELAVLLVKARLQRIHDKDLVLALQTAGWFQRQPAVILDLATRVTAEHVRNRVEEPDSFGETLIEVWLGPAGRPGNREGLAEMAEMAQAQLELSKRVAKMLEPHTSGPGWAARTVGKVVKLRSKDEHG